MSQILEVFKGTEIRNDALNTHEESHIRKIPVTPIDLIPLSNLYQTSETGIPVTKK